tara:strand:+ start:1447 stop:2160 length:714 start_codon:yes stop_codon:yes gene_type:complete
MTRFIALISGKGGVGKTTSVINIGQALSKLGKKTILLDANLTTPNLASHLGFINPPATLNHFLRREKELHEIIYQHPSGLKLIPTSTSYEELQKTHPQQLTEIFEHLDDLTDLVLVDTPSGLEEGLSQVLKNTDEVLIVVSPDLSSVMDALKSLQLALENNNLVPGIILNMTNKGKHELKNEEIEKMLHCPIIGKIKFDKKIKKSLHQGMPVNHTYPRAQSSQEFKKIAKHLCTYIY